MGLGPRRNWTGRVAVSGELRDMIHLCDGSPEFFSDAARIFCREDATLHHFQLRAALRIEL